MSGKTHDDTRLILERLKDTLIDEYKEGLLSTNDRKDVEKHILVEPENAAKLTLTNNLEHHAQRKRSNEHSGQRGKIGQFWNYVQSSVTFCGIVATTAIILSVGYGFFLHTKLRRLDDQMGIVKEEQKDLLRQVREFKQKLKENDIDSEPRLQQELYRSRIPLGMLTSNNTINNSEINVAR